MRGFMRRKTAFPVVTSLLYLFNEAVEKSACLPYHPSLKLDTPALRNHKCFSIPLKKDNEI
ncbi:MAG: hypothetical protein CVU50_06730 [Candidatus Cloacimonetes bacterium HGW-Cloacimonetes-3]|nr:MAG: hypothetical protein CVU50_06730 [Candidatus Cloacimonetes bacterium HGW-Cloacimonetes-3]